ncbi:MAG: hypothetical protein KGL53_07245 [Elusimicrobia bacterium]|nr:hypothetical protein [Elusimicrobiota bacterium]
MRLRAPLLLGALAATACAAPRPASPPPARAAAVSPVPDVDAGSDPKALLAAVRDAYSHGDYARGLALMKRVIEDSSDKVTAYDRIGSTYFALGRDGEALGMWERALSLEEDPKRKAELAGSIALARRSLGLPEPPAEGKGAPPPEKPPRPRKVRRDPAASKKLYEEGVAKYADSEYLSATALFMKALELDPSDEAARKALKRLRLKPAAP